MAGIDVVAPRPWRVWTFRLAFVPCDPLDEGVLFVRVCFPQEAAHLVVADADPSEQILHPGGRIADAEGILKPPANLIGVAEATRADLLFELIHLVDGELARVALVVERAENVESLVAIDAEPFSQLAQANTQQMNDFLPAFAPRNHQDGSEALVDTPVKGILAASFDLPPLLGGQDNRFHGRRCARRDGAFRLPSLSQVNGWRSSVRQRQECRGLQ